MSAQSVSSPANNDEPALRELQKVETITVKSQPGGPTLLPVRCDNEGNIYIRFLHRGDVLKEPIVKFDRSGERQSSYSIASDPDFEKVRGAGAIDFAIGKDGSVYELGATIIDNTPAEYIVPFAKDGAAKSKIKLGERFSVDRFDVFDSGDFLITGTDRETKQNPTPHSIYTGIFDDKGKLLKKVVLPEDADYAKAAERRDNAFFDAGQGGGGNFAVERGMVTRASDGNLYVMRWTIPTKVYAISPGGEVVRSFEVTPELEGKKPASIRAHGTRLAIQFEGNENDTRSLIKVVGLDGHEYAAYDSTEAGIAFACYSSDPERFTFLSADTNLQFTVYAPKSYGGPLLPRKLVRKRWAVFQANRSVLCGKATDNCKDALTHRNVY